MLRSLETTKHRVRLGTELLERRQLLAGAVEVFLMGGNELVVVGDHESNQMSVTRFEDEIVFAALDEDTRINGQLEVSFPVEVADGDVFIDLGNGDNVLRLGGETHDDSETEHGASVTTEDTHDDSEERLTFFGDVQIVTGRGSDSIRVSFVDIMGNLTIDTTSGSDAINIGRGPGFGGHSDHAEAMEPVAIATALTAPSSADDHGGTDHDGGDHGGDPGPPADVFVGGLLSIKAGSGEDGVKVAFTEVVDNLVIDSGPDDDYVLTGRGPVHGEHGDGKDDGGHDDSHDALIESDEDSHDDSHDDSHGGSHGGSHGDTGRPPDLEVFGDMLVSTGAGDDFALLRNTFVVNELRFQGRSGNDTLGTQNLTVAGDASLDGSSGNDVLAVMASRFHESLTIDGRSGEDLVFIGSTQVDGHADIDLASSDDALAITASQFNSPVVLNGGSGTDSSEWDRDDNEFNSTVEEKSFENDSSLDMDEIIAAIEAIFAGFLQGRL